MQLHDKIYIAGHRGLVGSALLRQLMALGYQNLFYYTHDELDLVDQQVVQCFFKKVQPDYVFLAAAKVGGILANSRYPAQFIYNNLAIQNNVLHEAYRAGVKRLIFLGSSCIYPRECSQPIQESYLLTGPLESTNRAYAVAKIAGAEMCWAYNKEYQCQYMVGMPSNVYGPYDNYDLEDSHVMAGLIRRFHEAKENNLSAMKVWGSGQAKREFLYSEDLADACCFLMNLPNEKVEEFCRQDAPPLINLGSGEDIQISELVSLVKDIVGYRGDVQWDTSKPDGTPRKLLDVSLLRHWGWAPKISFKDGILRAYQHYLDRLKQNAFG